MYSVRYYFKFGWAVCLDCVRVGDVYHRTEWEAIDELKLTDPAAAEDLYQIHSSVG